MIFGFRNNKKKPTLRPLNEKDIRARLYGGTVGTAADSRDESLPKRQKPDENKNSMLKKQLESEKIKIRKELALLKEELRQTKRRLEKMRGLKTKKIRLLAILLLAFLSITILAAIIIKQLYFIKGQIPKAATPKAALKKKPIKQSFIKTIKK